MMLETFSSRVWKRRCGLEEVLEMEMEMEISRV